MDFAFASEILTNLFSHFLGSCKVSCCCEMAPLQDTIMTSADSMHIGKFDFATEKIFFQVVLCDFVEFINHHHPNN